MNNTIQVQWKATSAQGDRNSLDPATQATTYATVKLRKIGKKTMYTITTTPVNISGMGGREEDHKLTQ